MRGEVRKMIHKNYVEISNEMVKHVDKMYGLINQYAKENGIKLAYDDRAEVLVEALATYIVESGGNKDENGAGVGKSN
jgi:hypothetical protein